VTRAKECRPSPRPSGIAAIAGSISACSGRQATPAFQPESPPAGETSASAHGKQAGSKKQDPPETFGDAIGAALGERQWMGPDVAQSADGRAAAELFPRLKAKTGGERPLRSTTPSGGSTAKACHRSTAIVVPIAHS